MTYGNRPPSEPPAYGSSGGTPPEYGSGGTPPPSEPPGSGPGYGSGGGTPPRRNPLLWLLPVVVLVGVVFGVYSCTRIDDGDTPPAASSAPVTTATPVTPTTTAGPTSSGTTMPPTTTVPSSTAVSSPATTTAPSPSTAAATTSPPVPTAVEAGSGGPAADRSGQSAVLWALGLAGVLLGAASSTVLLRRHGHG